MRVDLFDYSLPARLIAQAARARGESRLLRLDRATGRVSHGRFAEFPEHLRPGDLLVRNDVRVRPTRLYGADARGRLVEMFLVSPLGADRRRWTALTRPGRRARPGRAVVFEEGLRAVVEDVRGDGLREVAFDREIGEDLLERIGHVPLPPYIRREPGAPDRPEDREAYQTVFAREPLAVAAPTAGLHFTNEILDRVRDRGIGVVDLTLAVGPGTFKPVIVEETESHRLDGEEVFLPAATLRAVAQARADGRRVVAVGTTVTRALEAAARRPEGFSSGEDLHFSTDLFIAPGFSFQVIDALLTNFHLPRSTLIMLVSAFAGRENVLAAYREAIGEDYLFYSFGDAMLVT